MRIKGNMRGWRSGSQELANGRAGWRMFALLLLLLATAFAAIPAAAQDDSDANPGTNIGNYNVKQSITFGYRYVNQTGSTDVYDTFVNLGEGVRLFDQSLDVRSLNHNGALFDTLTMSSFGLGGDPNDVTRLRVSKNKLYEFTGSFRRDKNFWDYNLLANPLNPAGFTQITNSPHNLDLVRRNTDLDLLLLPQSRFRIRLGYNRNVQEGPSMTTANGESIISDLGDEPGLFQNWKTTMNSFRIGFDYRVARNTVVSYDQFLEYFKQDTSSVDQNLNFQVSNGTPVDLGLVFSPGTPCAAPIQNPNTIPPTIYAGCDAITSYSQVGRPRTSMPTERLGFTSTYFKNLEMNGHLTYSSSNMSVLDGSTLFTGNVGRTQTRATTSAGPANAERVSAEVDFGITWQVTNKFRISDTYRYYNWRIPGQWAFETSGLYAGAPLNPDGTPSLLIPPGQFNPTSCPPPFTANTCPQHNSSSGPDIANGIHTRFLGENDSSNTLQLGYDFTPRFGGHIGYRYGYRNISNLDQVFYNQEVFYPGPQFLPGTNMPASYRGDCTPDANGNLPPGCTLQSNGSVIFSGELPGSDTMRNPTIIHEQSLLFGVWALPAGYPARELRHGIILRRQYLYADYASSAADISRACHVQAAELVESGCCVEYQRAARQCGHRELPGSQPQLFFDGGGDEE